MIGQFYRGKILSFFVSFSLHLPNISVTGNVSFLFYENLNSIFHFKLFKTFTEEKCRREDEKKNFFFFCFVNRKREKRGRERVLKICCHFYFLGCLFFFSFFSALSNSSLLLYNLIFLPLLSFIPSTS